MDNRMHPHALFPHALRTLSTDIDLWPKCWCGKNVKASKRGDPTLYCSPAHRERWYARLKSGRDLRVNYIQFNNGTKAQQTIRRRLVGYQHAMSARTI